MFSRRITIDEIRSLYPSEWRRLEKTNLWAYYVLRKISCYPSWLVLKLGAVSANKVSWASLVLGLIGCVCLAFGNYWLMIVGVLLVNIWGVLDAVDGAVARYNKVSNKYGELTDTTCDWLMGLFIFTGAGIAAYNHPDSSLNWFVQLFGDISIARSVFLVLGGWASFFYVFPRSVSNEFVKLYLESGRDDVVAELREDVFGGFPYIIATNLYSITGLILPILLLATILKFLSIIVLLWAVINTFAGIFLLIQVFRRARSSV